MARKTAKLACLGLLLLGLLAPGFSGPGIAGVYSDPVSKIRAQDETVYANAALGAATAGSWMTPKVMGRYLLVKPPLLVWLAGASIKTLGTSRFALRLPVLLAALLSTVLLFRWAEKAHGILAAAMAALLLVSNPLWHTFSRVCYTDMLLVLATAAALFVVLEDPGLSRRRTIVITGAAVAVAVMAKNAAGILPLLIMLVFYLVSGKRPRRRAIAEIAGLTFLLAAPWHVYQVVAHPQWFWTDYIRIQLLQFGLHPPVQPSPENPVVFYLRRLVLTDPVLFVLALIALPGLVRAVRGRKTEAALLLAWLVVAAGTLLAFRYRNLPYLLYAVPPLCLVAAGFGPLANARRRKFAVALLAAVFCVKIVYGSRTWGLPFGESNPIPSAQALRWYAGLMRPAELITVNPDDEFYASVLPIPKVRYCYVDAENLAQRYAPHYAWLGITVDEIQFRDLERWRPRFRERLRAWGLDSTEAVATTITVKSAAGVAGVVSSRPHSDFFLPAVLRAQVEREAAATHRIVGASPQRIFLLARNPGPRPVPPHRTLSDAW